MFFKNELRSFTQHCIYSFEIEYKCGGDGDRAGGNLLLSPDWLSPGHETVKERRLSLSQSDSHSVLSNQPCGFQRRRALR